MNKGISGYIGENYVMIELLRKGFKAYFPTDRTQAGWDILVLKKNKNIKIQVKAIDWSASSPTKTIRGNFKSGNFDYLALVIINFCKVHPYRVFIIPKLKIKQKVGGNNQDFIDNNFNILYSIPKNPKSRAFSITVTQYKTQKIFQDMNREYLNRFDLIK